MGFRPSVEVIGASIFAAFAVIITVIRLEIPFPILPYLKFDFAEIPVTVCFLIFGPLAGVSATLVYGVVLSLRTPYIIGPVMKVLAVLSMMLGFYIGGLLCKRLKPSGKYMAIGVIVATGLVFRVLIMSFLNLLLLLVIAPGYVNFVASLFEKIGIYYSSMVEVVLLTLLLTGLFNAVHVLLSILPSLGIASTAISRISDLQGKTWLEKISEHKIR